MKSVKLVLLSIFSCIILISCGNKEAKKKEGFSYEKKSSAQEKVEVNQNEVVLTSNDAMQFNKKELRVQAGKKVKLTLTHVGKFDKKVMGHNFVLLNKDVNIVDFGNKALNFPSNDYIPSDSQDVIAYTKLIGGGETVVIEFDAPKVGVYDFICSFPGHYAIMKGKFIVE